MKELLIVTAVIELGAGVALLALPSAMATLLLGTPLTEPAALSVGRVGGAALLSLSVACGLASSDAQTGAARGLIAAVLLYNVAVAVILGAAGIGSRPVGVALWPTVIVHAVMTAWCVARLLQKAGAGSPKG